MSALIRVDSLQQVRGVGQKLKIVRLFQREHTVYLWPNNFNGYRF